MRRVAGSVQRKFAKCSRRRSGNILARKINWLSRCRRGLPGVRQLTIETDRAVSRAALNHPGRDSEQRQLIRMGAADLKPPMQARIDTIKKRRKALLELDKRLRPAVRKPHTLPDFIEAPGIAGVALDQVLAPHAKPARDPDVDRILFGQRPAGDGRRRRGEKYSGHDTGEKGTLDGVT